MTPASSQPADNAQLEPSDAARSQPRALELLRLAVLGGSCAATPLIVWLSLIPGDMQTRTVLPKQAEHFLAYFLAAACICLVLRESRQRLGLAVAFPALAAALELAQALVPGRTPGLADFIGGSLGAWCGMAAAMAGLALMGRMRRHRGFPRPSRQR